MIGSRVCDFFTTILVAGVLYSGCLSPDDAAAQWQVPNYSVPIGRGAGITGFKSAAPGTAGGVLTSNGASSDPTFQTPSGITCQADNTGATDVTTVIQACLDASSVVSFRPGTYKITALLSLNNNQTVIMSPGVIIQQNTKDTLIFYALGKSNITILGNGGILYGKGIYCGNPGQGVTASCPSGQVVGNVNDVGIYLDTGTTNVWIDNIHTKNTAGGGIFLVGASHVKITNLFAEGTNLYTTAVAANANYQAGVSESGSTDISIINPEITGTAQGILVGGGASTRTVQIASPNFHDITGQHGFYGSRGGVNITNARCTNLALACIKEQIQTVGQDSQNFTAIGVIANNIGGNMFEIGVVGGVGLHNVELSGVGNTVSRGISVGGAVTRLFADIIVQNSTSEAAIVQGDGGKDIDIRIISTSSNIDGVLVTATNADRITIRPTIRQPGITGPGTVGVHVNSATANVTLVSPVIEDTGGFMTNGIKNTTAGGTIKILNYVAISGASLTCINAVGGTVTALPIWTNLSCTGGNYTNEANISRGALGDVSVPFTSFFLSGTSGGIPYFSTDTTVTSSAALGANQLVVGGGAGAAPASIGTLGTTTTVLHGNAAGAPSFSAIVSADLNITTTSCTNQFVSAISATAVGTCSTVSASQLGGLGTGVATALAVNVGTAGAFVVNGGALGSPSSVGTMPAFTLGGDITGAGNKLTTTTSTNGGFAGVHIRNSNSGNAAFGYFSMQNDTAGPAVIGVASTTYSGTLQQNRLFFQGSSTLSGIAFDSGVAGAPIVFGINSTETARITPNGGLAVNTTSDPGAGMIYTNSASFMNRTKTSWTNGAGAGAGTIANAPSAGNPTKWIPVDDNGTTRYIPAW